MAERMRSFIAQRGFGFWAVELHESQAFIGFVGLHVPTAELPFSPCVEIGWRLGFPYWGQGYATEAAQEALRFAFAELKLPEIISFTAIGNRRSQAVMQRLNMPPEPEPEPETFQHPDIPRGHPLREHCWYRLSREERAMGRCLRLKRYRLHPATRASTSKPGDRARPTIPQGEAKKITGSLLGTGPCHEGTPDDKRKPFNHMPCFIEATVKKPCRN